MVPFDGGTGREIQGRLEGAATGLWSAQALLERPDLVRQIHSEFIEAGADVITTNTYSTLPSYLGKAGLADRYEELAGLAGRLAHEAAEATGGKVRVAGSLPPLDESYRTDLVPDRTVALPIYENLVKVLNPYVDIFLCETMSTVGEARNAAGAALTFGEGKEVYVSFTLDETPGGGLRDGTSVRDAVRGLADLELSAWLFNCTHPEAIVTALGELRALTEMPIGCYPNRLNKVARNWTLDNEVGIGLREDLSIADFIGMSRNAIAAGASVVGGCCGIGPDYIRALAEAVRKEA